MIQLASAAESSFGRPAYGAFEAAGGQGVRLGGGAATIRQFLRAGLIDDFHLVVVPVLLGAGERPFADGDGALTRYDCTEFVCSRTVAHVRLNRAET
jgi:dihydrofolate reductase